MPKMKTKSALVKRIKVTATGKVLRGNAYRSHLAQNKSRKQKLQSRKRSQMHSSDLKRFKGMF
ncbi:MAG: 50S ribosomal protein L35 [Mollicutes bacterium PWAP]|nr:50S ribosomal protein L35 [Mollicutes bacterium PWAP]